MTKDHVNALNHEKRGDVGQVCATWRTGVAVRSSVGSLKRALHPFPLEPRYGEERIVVGNVRYMDYASEDMVDHRMLGVLRHKRCRYGDEREARGTAPLRMAAGVRSSYSGSRSYGLSTTANSSTRLRLMACWALSPSNIESFARRAAYAPSRFILRAPLPLTDRRPRPGAVERRPDGPWLEVLDVHSPATSSGVGAAHASTCASFADTNEPSCRKLAGWYSYTCTTSAQRAGLRADGRATFGTRRSIRRPGSSLTSRHSTA